MYVQAIRLQTVLECTRRCIWRRRSSEHGDGALRDALGDRDRVNLEVYFETVLATLGDGNRANLEVYLETVMAVLGDGNRANLEMYLEAMILRT
jgi:hypothetical protein